MCILDYESRHTLKCHFIFFLQRHHRTILNTVISPHNLVTPINNLLIFHRTILYGDVSPQVGTTDRHPRPDRAPTAHHRLRDLAPVAHRRSPFIGCLKAYNGYMGVYIYGVFREVLGVDMRCMYGVCTYTAGVHRCTYGNAGV